MNGESSYVSNFIATHGYSFAPPAITSAIIILFALTSLTRIRTSMQYRSLFLLCISTLWWHLSWVFLFLTKDQGTAEKIAIFGHVGIIALPFSFHYFYMTLIRKDKHLFLTKGCLYLLFVVCLIMTNWLISGVNHFEWGFYPKGGPVHLIFLAVLTVFMSEALFRVYKESTITTSSSHRSVLRICLAAGVIYDFAAVDFLINYNLSTLYPFGFIFSIIFIVMVSYAVFTHDLFSRELEISEINKSLEESKRRNEELTEAIARETRKLQEAQATLIQSEKMASLGTLSAGISHSILYQAQYIQWKICFLPCRNLSRRKTS